MKAMKYICVCLLIGQIFVTPVLSYAEELNQSAVDNVIEDSKKSPLTDSEYTSNQSRELDEEATIDSSVKSENGSDNIDNQLEKTSTDENILQESSDTRSSDLEQQEVRETRGVFSSMWGTSPVTFDEETGVLTIEAGTITNYNGQKFDDNGKIPVASVKEIIFQEGVVFPTDSSQLFTNAISLEKVSGPVDTSNVTDMGSMFFGSGLTTIDVSGWDVSKVTNMTGMFAFSNIRELDVSNWDTRKMPKMELWTSQTGLKEIKLGENFRFGQEYYPEYPPLDYIMESSDVYSSGWKRINPIEPRVVYKSSTDLVASYDGSFPGTYTWQEWEWSLEIKDSILYVGESWEAKDNFVSATDKYGDPKELNDRYIDFEGSVDTDTPGVYEVTYMNREKDLYDPWKKIAKVTVKENKATLKVKDSTLYVGDNWTSADNLVSATDKEGTALKVNDLEIEGTVDTKTAGVYEVTYKNGSLSETAKITVKENKATLKVKDSTLYVGDKWALADNFVSATDKDGNKLTVGDLEVEGTVDTSTAGVYEVTYKNGSLNETAKVTMKENKATLKAKDSTLYVGDKWTSKDNFVSATDKDGNALTVDDLEVEGTVDTNTAGVYEVTYKNGSLSETAKVTVKENKATLKVKDSTLNVGESWTSADNLVSATDKEGTALKVNDLEIEGTVDTKTAGVYEIKYKNGSLSATAKVTVKENKATLKVKDSTLYVGDNWTAGDNLVSATDKEGTALTVSDLEVEGTVDTKTADVYEVTYKNGSLSETAKVTVKDLNENDQTTLEVKDSILYVGDKWEAKNNFISATDKDGNTLKIDELQIEGVVNTKNTGIYEVTYKNGNLIKVAKVTVKEKPSISTSNGDQAGKQSQDKGSRNKQVTNNSNNSLPKAGEKSAFYISVMGILLLISGLVVMYRRTKVKK
ncbi:bacterial Ig-like domain-containing protein [Enterococcus faecalis]